MHFTAYLAMALPMASIVYGEMTESLSRSRVARAALQEQQYSRRASSVKMVAPSISSIEITSATASNGTSHNMTFVVADTNTNTTTTCTHGWTDVTANGVTTGCPTAYITCSSPTSNTTAPAGTAEHWQWYFGTYTSPLDWTMEVDHTFYDSAVAGTTPQMNMVSIFSRATVASSNFTCGSDDSGLKTPCSLSTATAKYWGASA